MQKLCLWEGGDNKLDIHRILSDLKLRDLISLVRISSSLLVGRGPDMRNSSDSCVVDVRARRPTNLVRLDMSSEIDADFSTRSEHSLAVIFDD